MMDTFFCFKNNKSFKYQPNKKSRHAVLMFVSFILIHLGAIENMNNHNTKKIERNRTICFYGYNLHGMEMVQA